MGKFKSKSVKPTWTMPSTDLTKVVKAWRNVQVRDLDVGDIVANVGAVMGSQPTCDNMIALEVGYPESKIALYAPTAMVYAFTKKG